MPVVSARVPEPVRVDHAEVGIGEDRVVEPRVARERGVRRHRIDDDAGDRAAALAERVDSQLQTLQLRDAEGSPVAAVEDEKEWLPPEVGEADDLAGLVREREVGRGCADARPLRRGHDGHDVEERGEARRDHDVQAEQDPRHEPPPGRASHREPRQPDAKGDDDPVRYGVVAHTRQPGAKPEDDDEVADDAGETEGEAERGERDGASALVVDRRW